MTGLLAARCRRLECLRLLFHLYYFLYVGPLVLSQDEVKLPTKFVCHNVAHVIRHIINKAAARLRIHLHGESSVSSPVHNASIRCQRMGDKTRTGSWIGMQLKALFCW